MKKIYLALILFLLVMVVGCGKETEQRKILTFKQQCWK